MGTSRRQVLVAAVCGITLGGCCSDDIVTLQKRNTELTTQLGQVTVERRACDNELQKVRNLNQVLMDEKKAKDGQLSKLKDVYRTHIREQYKQLNGLLENDELLDYYGGEIIIRNQEQGSDVTLIYQRPMEKNGRILQARANVASKTRFHLLVFKQLEKELLCVYASDPLEIDEASKMVRLPVPVHIQAGDLVGFHFPDKVGVPFDDYTGDFSVYKSKGQIGERIERSKTDSEKRNYSLGVLAELE